MKRMLQLLVGIGVLTMLFSCAGGDEAKGDRAYNAAKKATGNERREQLKTAYTHYRNAVNSGGTISTQLRNRFIEMSIVRVEMMLTEGNINMGGIPLLMEDIEKKLTDDVQHDLRQRYAAFLVQRGDSSAARDRFIDALAFYNRAIELAADATPFREKRNSVIRNVAEENYQLGRMELEIGMREKDEKHLIRAEYFAKVALYFDSTFQKAQRLLSEAFQQNVGTYAAFLAVVEDYTDTVMFRKINKYDILLAVPAVQNRGGATVAEIHMHSNTYNPLRMRSQHFTFVNAEGRRFQAREGQRMTPDILDQEREAKFVLHFPLVTGRIKKLVYENGPHKTEKYFF